jgi:hypothetical protein
MNGITWPNIDMDLKETMSEDAEWINLPQLQGPVPVFFLRAY